MEDADAKGQNLINCIRSFFTGNMKRRGSMGQGENQIEFQAALKKQSFELN